MKNIFFSNIIIHIFYFLRLNRCLTAPVLHWMVRQRNVKKRPWWRKKTIEQNVKCTVLSKKVQKLNFNSNVILIWKKNLWTEWMKTNAMETTLKFFSLVWQPTVMMHFSLDFQQKEAFKVIIKKKWGYCHTSYCLRKQHRGYDFEERCFIVTLN